MNTRLTTILALIFAVLAGAASALGQPQRVIGRFEYKSLIIAKYFSVNSTPALLCVSRDLMGTSDEWVPNSEQILGRYTKPIYPSPIEFEIQLPIKPICKQADVDYNGRPDAGVQIFATEVGINIFGDNHLEQLEQEAAVGSFLFDAKNKTIRKGSFLIFAPDSDQRVPSGFGPDHRLFTADDPTVAVPAGYSLMRIGEDRSITFDRSIDLSVDILQEEEANDPDFSSLGLVKAFDSLINLLKERYAYTALRKVDWERKRSEYRPRIADAEKRNDLQDYYLAIYEFAAGINDGHVQTGSYDPKLSGKRFELIKKRFAGGLGARVIRYSDGRFMVYAVGPGSPAEQAGIKVGTEIVKIDGKSVLDHLATTPPFGFTGTTEMKVARELQFIFSFPLGQTVNVEFKQPGDPLIKSAQLVSRIDEGTPNFPYLLSTDPFTIKKLGKESNIGYFRWSNFEDVALNIAAYETFLGRNTGEPGIIMDVRGNGGGLLGLMYSMAAYLFPADKPVSLNWLDAYVYDDATRAFVKGEVKGDKKISSPRPALTFTGTVVVLVDGESASAAEFFSQFLQKQGRAVVIADSGTDGAGGTVRRAILPGKLPVSYTGGQMYFAGTKEVNLEGKGVIADIRIPIDDDYVERRLKGEDVVLKRAVEYVESKTQVNKAPSIGGGK